MALDIAVLDIENRGTKDVPFGFVNFTDGNRIGFSHFEIWPVDMQTIDYNTAPDLEKLKNYNRIAYDALKSMEKDVGYKLVNDNANFGKGIG